MVLEKLKFGGWSVKGSVKESPEFQFLKDMKNKIHRKGHLMAFKK